MYTYKPNGVCSKQIDFEIEDGIVTYVKFHGGCMGNTTGVAQLVKGMKVDDVINRLEGITCRTSTSCPDQLATALKQYQNENK